MSDQTATGIAERDYRKSRERFDRDQRFRAVVQSVIHDVLGRHPDLQNREGHDLAQDVAATMLERIYTEDAELQAQRALAERYRSVAEDALAVMSPFRLIEPAK